jgi:hypothetical protein
LESGDFGAWEDQGGIVQASGSEGGVVEGVGGGGVEGGEMENVDWNDLMSFATFEILQMEDMSVELANNSKMSKQTTPDNNLYPPHANDPIECSSAKTSTNDLTRNSNSDATTIAREWFCDFSGCGKSYSHFDKLR